MTSFRWLHWAAFAYTWMVFGITFGMKAVQSGVKPYYISGLLNSGDDTVAEFFVRWILWGSIPVVLFRVVRRRFSSCWAWTLLVAWMLAIVTGFDPRVFDGPGPPDALRYSHYGASGLVLLVCSLLLLRVQKWLGGFWLVVTVVYCGTFLASDLVDDLDIPSEIYITTEYVLYLTMGVVLLLLPTIATTTSPPLDNVRVVSPPAEKVNILARERDAERMRR